MLRIRQRFWIIASVCVLALVAVSVGVWRIRTSVHKPPSSAPSRQRAPATPSTVSGTTAVRPVSPHSGESETASVDARPPSAAETEPHKRPATETPPFVKGLVPLVVASEGDLLVYDREFDRGWPLRLLAIPQPRDATSGAYLLQPTTADAARRSDIEAEIHRAAMEGRISGEPQSGFTAVVPDEGKRVYVRDDYVQRYLSLLEEDRRLHARSMRPVLPDQQITYGGEPRKQAVYPDGSEINYYRRRDGALIRAVTKPNGSVSRWVIGWASTDGRDYGVPQQVMDFYIGRYWRDE